MKKYLTLVIIIGFLSCNLASKRTVQGDLSFKLISMNSLYGAESKDITKIERAFEEIDNNSKSKLIDKEASRFFRKLKRYGLYTAPYIFLNIGSDSTMVVYLSESEYNKVKGYSHVDLEKRDKKVILELEIEEKDVGLFYSERIIRVTEKDGKTIVRK